jgi:molybdenum cofactor cytidylyltransferase
MNPSAPAFRVGICILAAGLSARMHASLGKHKLLLPMWGEPLLAHTLRAYCTLSSIHSITPPLAQSVDNFIEVADIVVVCGAERTDIEEIVSAMQEAFPAAPLRSVWNADYASGMASSICVGVAALLSQFSLSSIMIGFGDMPFVSVSLLQQLCTYSAQHPNSIIIPTIEGRRGHPVVFPALYAPQLMALHGDSGAKVLIEKATNEDPEAVLETPTSDWGIVVDIDTAEAYEQYKQIASRVEPRSRH